MLPVGYKNFDRILDYIHQKGLDAILLKSPDPNIKYLTGFTGSGILIISSNGCTLVTKQTEPIKNLKVNEIIHTEDSNSFKEILRRELRKKRVGIVKSSINLKFFEEIKHVTKARFFDVEEIFARLRAVKFQSEIKLLKKAGKIATDGIKLVSNLLEQKSVTEKEIERTLACWLMKNSDGISFEILVASGERAFSPHPSPNATERKITGLGYVDFGAVFHGYHSDITIPFVKGNITGLERFLIKVLEEAYDLALNLVEVGKKTWEVHENVEKFLNQKGLKLHHGLGHGLGLAVHDYPSISPHSTNVIEMEFLPNMVFTIEPGIYHKMRGIRLENDFLLTERGLKRFTGAGIIWV